MAVGRYFLIVFLLGAVAYTATVSFAPYPFDFMLKIVPIAALIGFAAQNLSGSTRVLTLGALCFSAGGDVMLSLAFPNQFVFGLSSFLVAQIIYVIVFLRYRRAEHLPIKLVLASLAIIYAVVLGGIVMPEQADLKIAVSSYMLVISCMVLAAVFALGKSWTHLLGAVTFMISDSLIAWNKFHEPVPAAGVAVMATYYLAQYLIVTGVVRLSKAEEHHELKN